MQLYFPKPRCVSKEVCARKDVVSGPRQDIIIQDASLLQHALAEEAECSDDNSQICCHQEDITPGIVLFMPGIPLSVLNKQSALIHCWILQMMELVLIFDNLMKRQILFLLPVHWIMVRFEMFL